MPVCHSDLFEAGGVWSVPASLLLAAVPFSFSFSFLLQPRLLKAPIRALVAIAARSRHPGHRSCDPGAHSRKHAPRQSLPTTARHGAPTSWWRPWRAPCSDSQTGFGHRLWSHPPSIRPAIQLSQLWPDASPARPGPPALQLSSTPIFLAKPVKAAQWQYHPWPRAPSPPATSRADWAWPCRFQPPCSDIGIDRATDGLHEPRDVGGPVQTR